MNTSNSIVFQADGSPYSAQFDDIYFDTESGCLQSEQVFIKGNDIDALLTSNNDEVTIAETGFGTGLNFILTLKRYLELSKTQQLSKLHFISTEKFPLTQSQLIQSLQCLPQLAEISQMLTDNYPEYPQQNYTAKLLDNRITLTLLFDDSTKALSQLTTDKSGLVDAWYLDGFTPNKNPEMWQPELFSQIGRLSKAQASIATFTVAGIVKRRLIDNGFRVQRLAYGGKKKEILVGKLQNSTRLNKGFQLRPINLKPQHVAIIGGGIASACTAYSLVKRGIKVTIYCQDGKIAQGASSNKIGALYPLIHQKKDDISCFYQQAFFHAKAYYQDILDQGFHFDHDWCGLLELAHNDNIAKRQQGIEQKNIWPNTLLHGVDQTKAEKIANIPLKSGGIFYPEAGWIAPQQLVTQLIKAAAETGLCKVELFTPISEIKKHKSKWLLTSYKENFKASTVVIAAGNHTPNFAPFDQLPMSPVRGQVSSMRTNSSIDNLTTVICHKGYLTPANNGVHCIGATFDKGDQDTNPRAVDDDYNLNMLNKCMDTTFGWTKADIADSKARIRCVTPDHMPIVGAMAKITDYPELYPHLAKDKNWRYTKPAPFIDNLFILSGLGARGLCSAPLLADILAADISGSPYPVDNTMLFNLSSNRFVIRDIIKRKFES